MPIRYRLLRFDSASISTPDAAKTFLEDLGGFQHSPLASLSTRQWTSTLQQAIGSGAKTILLQDAVRDPDFLEEYEAFYSKQQKDITNLCRRIHFFSSEIGEVDTPPANSDILSYIDAAAEAPETYLGFVTIRPLRHAPVGATILPALSDAPVTCKDEFPVHIAGRQFSVVGTPYLQQDNAVGACAQVSIWVALRTLRRRLGNSAYSPAELTVAATKHFTTNRVFPGRGGLTTHQMLEAIRSAGHDPLIVEPWGPTKADIARQALEFATPYLESGIPVILGLNNVTGGHAIVAIGYIPSENGGVVPDKLIVHNDNAGCYLNLPPHAPPSTAEATDYALDQTMALIAPLPDGICMTAAEAESFARIAFAFALPFLVGLPPFAQFIQDPNAFGGPPPCIIRIFLSTRHSFRHWASNALDIDSSTKITYRISELPKFVWVAEIHEQSKYQAGFQLKNSRLGEIVLDASADAPHGDGLLFIRLSGHLLGAQASNDGILVIERPGSTRDILAIKAPASFGQNEPWR